MVKVRGLVKSYGGRRVVDGLDLDVGEGEVVGIIGSNGAGKTTTAECIQGLRRSDCGSVRVFGVDPVRDADRLRGLVGSQLQSAALPDRMRVREAVELFSGTSGDDLLEQFGLAERRSSAFASLSGGERQRLFLVLALVNAPQLVILDELTQGLDPAARRDVWSAVDVLRTEGKTVLVVTHELDEAEALCGRVIAMRAGRVLDSGSPAELVDRHGRSAEITFSSADVDPGYSSDFGSRTCRRTRSTGDDLRSAGGDRPRRSSTGGRRSRPRRPRCARSEARGRARRAPRAGRE